jgi:hypothetical protein
VVATVQIEGGYKKPELNDLYIVKLFMLPLTLSQWASTYHRRYLSGAALSEQEKMQMAKEAVGPGTWQELTPVERLELVERKIWLWSELYKWRNERAPVVVEKDDEVPPEGAAPGGREPNRKEKRKLARMKKNE